MKLMALLSAFATLVLAACGAPGELPALPTPIATYVRMAGSEQPASLQPGADLPIAVDANATCDAAAGAELACTTVDGVVHLDTTINAGVFSRWSLALDVPALAGYETLQLRLRKHGDVFPNLYFVDRAGIRVPVALDRYGLDEQWRTLHIPLREVHTQEGLAPDLSDLQALEVVFEWADMAGGVEIESVRFVPVWTEAVGVTEAARELAAGLTVPAGFQVVAVAENLHEMTQIDFTAADEMLVSLQNGRVWRYEDMDGDGLYARRHLYDSGYDEVVGLLADPVDGAVWLGGRGRLYRTHDSDGDGAADVRELRLDGLPWGRHQNNGLAWNPGPDPFTGEAAASWIYFGLGSTGDLETGGELNATVLRFPRDGMSSADLEVVSRGNRNAYMVAWGEVPHDPADPASEKTWQLFASENGPDFNDAPDEVNHIRWQHHYGFPDHFGLVEEDAPAAAQFSGPLYPVTAHASASGLAYVDNPTWPAAYRTLYVSLFGQVFTEEVVGHTVERVTLALDEGAPTPTYRGTPSDFVTGLERPLPLATGPAGNLFVGDYATGVVYRIDYQGDD